MGIKGFSAWLRCSFPHVFCPIPTAPGGSNLQNLHFDQVYIDLNPFLHMAARQSNGIEDMVKSCRKNLKMAVQGLTKAHSLVYVSMDGPAPLAKLPEQRARRHDAAITAAKRNTFDAQQITPGCVAMTTIESQVFALLREIFFTSGKTGASQSVDFNAIIDGSGVEGEGEFKIIRKVLHDHVDGDAFKGRVTRAILACDADLFLQALLSDVPHLYLFDPFAAYNSQTTIFSVDRWRRALSAESTGSCSRRIAFDFVLFALMSGSDYAPALRYANYRSLWPTYLEFIKIQRENGKRLKLAEDSPLFTATIVNAEGKSVNLKCLKEFFEFYLKEGLGETLKEPLKAFHDELDPTGRNERILNYVEHLIWNLDGLVTCNVPDLSISMLTEKRAPSLLELADFDAEALQTILDERLKTQQKPVDSNTCKYPGVMALMALDRSTECEKYLAEPLKHLMKELKDSESELGRIVDDVELVKELTKRVDDIPKESFTLIERLASFPRSPIVLDKNISNSSEGANFYSMALKAEKSVNSHGAELPWMRSNIYAVNEEESWKCPLHRLLFSKYRNK
jgi:hypothetical protein